MAPWMRCGTVRLLWCFSTFHFEGIINSQEVAKRIQRVAGLPELEAQMLRRLPSGELQNLAPHWHAQEYAEVTLWKLLWWLASVV